MCKSKEDLKKNLGVCIWLLLCVPCQAYMEQDSLQRAKLQLAIQGYQEVVQQRQHHQEAVKASHGL